MLAQGTKEIGRQDIPNRERSIPNNESVIGYEVCCGSPRRNIVRIGENLPETSKQSHGFCHAGSIPFSLGDLPEQVFLEKCLNKVPG
jgi:hypothetical protein